MFGLPCDNSETLNLGLPMVVHVMTFRHPAVAVIGSKRSEVKIVELEMAGLEWPSL